MRLLLWFYGKGIPRTISKDLLYKYLNLKRLHPLEEEGKILLRLWNLWLTLNQQLIRTEDSAKKISRLLKMKEEIDPYSLICVYDAVLFINTGISPNDGKNYINALRVFVKRAKRHDLDYSQEFENMV